MKKLLAFFILITSLSILISCNSKKETLPQKTDITTVPTVVEKEQASPERGWKESLLSVNKISTQEDIETIKAIIEKAVENNNLEELQTFLEIEAIKDKVPPQILFGLSLVYGRKGLVKEEYKTIEKLEEQVKQRPGIAFNLSLVYGRKETLKSQIDKAEAEAIALLKGFISVVSTPAGAEVFINGKLKGTTPLTTKGLKEGSYSVEIRKENYTVTNKTVDVKSGETTKVTKRLTLIPGSLQVISDPVGSTVMLNGDIIGVTPLKLIELIPKSYELIVKKENYSTEKQNIEIRPGKSKTVDLTLITFLGNLSIRNLTDGAFVYLDGKRVYPQQKLVQQYVLKNIPTGAHSVLIHKDNYIDSKLSIFIKPDQYSSILGELQLAVFKVPFAKIKVDGKADDWNGIKPVYQYNLTVDPFPEDNGTFFKNLKVAYDDKKLYYILEFRDPPASRKKDYYYQINVYQSVAKNQRNYNLINGDIRVNHNSVLQPGGTFIWKNGNFKGTQNTYVRGSTYLEGSIPRNRITFNTDQFSISCVLNKIPGDVWEAQFTNISISE